MEYGLLYPKGNDLVIQAYIDAYWADWGGCVTKEKTIARA